MSLLQLLRVEGLYIPQCLYYNDWIFRIHTRTYLLYSPQCLYYNVSQIYAISRSNKLYIPQCLYYNENRSLSTVINEITLHSTMSLLQLCTCILHHSHWILYIPQCLYYNDVDFKIIMNEYILYIPQCLYYNHEDNLSYISQGSLYIPQCLYYNVPVDTSRAMDVPIFTFHNVSITTQIPQASQEITYTLHSTMSLLQPAAASAYTSASR